MEFIEASLEDSLANILRISERSFNGFYSKETIIERLKSKRYWVYIVKDGNAVIGYNICYEDGKATLYDWLMAVDSGYRRKGIATRLMDIQTDVAKRNGYSRITLKTHEGHPEMIALCRKRGFNEIKREPHHWGNERVAIFFECPVS